MRRSKLEIYITVLEALALDGPMRLNRITCKTNLNYVFLKRVVHDLRDRQLVEERKINNSFIYSATPKAKLALTQFNDMSQSFPFLKNAWTF